MKLFQRLAPWLLLAACLGDFSLPYLLGPHYPGFQQIPDLISQLGENVSPVQTAFNHGSIITGTLFVLGGLGVYCYFHPALPRLAVLLSGGIIFYGFGDCILTGVVKISPNVSFFSPAYFLHAAFSGLAMVVMIGLSLVLAGFFESLGQTSWAKLLVGLFILSGVTFVLFAAYYLPGIGKLLQPTRGLWQRLSLFFLYTPLVILAIFQLKYPKKNWPAA